MKLWQTVESACVDPMEWVQMREPHIHMVLAQQVRGDSWQRVIGSRFTERVPENEATALFVEVSDTIAAQYRMFVMESERWEYVLPLALARQLVMEQMGPSAFPEDLLRDDDPLSGAAGMTTDLDAMSKLRAQGK